MVSHLESLLADLDQTSIDKREKGDRFERLILAYLKHDAVQKERFSDAWLWGEWPDKPIGIPDIGIDLVAQERESGDFVAIQAKFYRDQTSLQKSDIDSFLAASGKYQFVDRIIATNKADVGKNVWKQIEDQRVPVHIIDRVTLEGSSIDWAAWQKSAHGEVPLKPAKTLRKHQQDALDDVKNGFNSSPRGKLIMACGTGKTFTSLRIAEDLVGANGTVLFLVPSIALLSQALREWSNDSRIPIRSFAVCSDTSVGKSKPRGAFEDISVSSLEIRATTDPERLFERLSDSSLSKGKMTVVFATYQSIDVVSKAQKLGLPEFNLVVCDEAHRTTGVTLAGDDEAKFVKVHNNNFLHAARRLYMTATPRLYDDNSKAKGMEANAILASMDDETLYGPEFHRLGFGDAVSRDLLTDYKVLILAVSEQMVSATFQSQMADKNLEIQMPDVAKIVGCLNGLAKRGDSEHDFGDDSAPMKRAVAFASSIDLSKKFSVAFQAIAEAYEKDTDDQILDVEVHHVDGTFNILKRNSELDWLRSEPAEGECRVLSNARCLSEGVDVPALDAVMFLNPRKSVVDVVQSVGRVMRKIEGKEYGYIILPIGVPVDCKPEDALKDNEKYRVVWEVLQALRAHDERFDAKVNQIELNKKRDSHINLMGVGFAEREDIEQDINRDKNSPQFVQTEFDLASLGEWRDAIYAKIVAKVGSRRYYESWAKDVAKIAQAHTTRIKGLLDNPDAGVREEFDRFLEGLRGNLNNSISENDAIDMLAQHLITKPVFDALFMDYDFTEHNPVARVMDSMIVVLHDHNLQSENEALEGFYKSVQLRVKGIDNAEGRHAVINELYEKFFKTAFPKSAESLGIVYTPTEIVDFILRSVDQILRKEFGSSLSDEEVHVLDPFTGTGTFIVRLLESGLIDKEALLRKYASELHANEILLLAYYIAAVNIETTFQAITEGEYEPFNGIVLADTFQMSEDGDALDNSVFVGNNQRVEEQMKLPIRVILGNPPYSAGQRSQNDANANLKYPTLDKRIERTYASRSEATNKNSLYDSYIRAIRWASDRIEDRGIIAFVLNNGFVDGIASSGVRKYLTEEFSSIYCLNLLGHGGDKVPEPIRAIEGGNVFDVTVGIAILFLVKQDSANTSKGLLYMDIGDSLSKEEKLAKLRDLNWESAEWKQIEPNIEGDWINQRTQTFDFFTPIGKKGSDVGIFTHYSGGLKANRDAWVYNYSEDKLRKNVKRMVDEYNSQLVAFNESEPTERELESKEFIDLDPTKIKWDSTLIKHFIKGVRATTKEDDFRVGLYRPFQLSNVLFNRTLNNSVHLLHRFFPTIKHPNIGIYIAGKATEVPFTTLISSHLIDYHLAGPSSGGQFFPRYTYIKAENEDFSVLPTFEDASSTIVDGYQCVDNITDAALMEYQDHFGMEVIKDDLFYYIYGLLHSPDYREMFAKDLKKRLPRIPKVKGLELFQQIVDAGRKLADLHMDYEDVEPYPVEIEDLSSSGNDMQSHFHVEKMKFGGKGKNADRSTIIYNRHITISGIPEMAHDYMLGSRSAIEWIMDQYQIKIDKRGGSGIINDPNDWSHEVDNPRYILDLLCKIITVSVETVDIVNSLPKLDFSNG